MFRYTLSPLTHDRLSEAVELDRVCLGGIWTLEGYEREFHSPNSDLFTIVADVAHTSGAGDISGITDASDRDPAGVSHPSGLDPSNLNKTCGNLVALGCLWSILDEAHITLLFVHPDHRRQGLGQQLLTRLLQSARSRGLAWATLEVSEKNTAALALYHKFGFETIGKRKAYYQKTGEDALILWLKGLQRGIAILGDEPNFNPLGAIG